MGIATSFKLSKISEQVSQVQALSVSLDAALANQRNAIDRIERCSLTSLRSSNNSLRSLGSIANSLSRLEATVPTETCSTSLNCVLRSAPSQRSLDRVVRKSLDDLSLGSYKHLAFEYCCQPRIQAPDSGGDLLVCSDRVSSPRLIMALQKHRSGKACQHRQNPDC